MENVNLSERELAVLKEKAKKDSYLNRMVEKYEKLKKEADLDEEKALMIRIKSFEDACLELGMKPKKIKCLSGKRGIASEKLAVIVKALNGKKHFKLPNDNVEHWHPVFYRRTNGTSLVFKGSSCDAENITGGNSALHTLRSKALSDYCGKQFRHLWEEYIL